MVTTPIVDGEPAEDHEVVIVGAGFAGVNALYRLREAGMDVRVVEAGGGVGGTWYWNRYPGARVDIESLEYSYGFRDDLQQEWHWTERYASQGEVRRYLEWVVDRLGLRDGIQLHSRLMSAYFDDEASRWTLTVKRSNGNGDDGTLVETLSARFLVLATGFLSIPRLPDIHGLRTFEGELLHTGAWPQRDVELAGRRIGVIGTAASGVQVVQSASPVAGHLTVFQRTANWCFPLRNEPMPPEYEGFVKDNYAEIRRLEHEVRGPGMVLMDKKIVLPESRRAVDVSDEERRADFEWRWNAGGVHMGRSFTDLVVAEEANEYLRAFLEGKIREIVNDPKTAAALIPDHPPLTRRPPGEAGYYESFNRDNVELVNLGSDPIADVNAAGVRLLSGRRIDLDLLVCATGFDSGSGAALRIDIRGRAGLTLREHWADRVRTHLGIAVAGFPNLLFLNGPQAPGAHFSPPLLVDHQSRHVVTLIEKVAAAGARTIEVAPEAEHRWSNHVDEVYAATLIPRTDSWWMAANVPGKPRQALAYGGGFQKYRAHCEAALTEGGGYVLA